jgi:hypothetical protein
MQAATCVLKLRRGDAYDLANRNMAREPFKDPDRASSGGFHCMHQL